MLSLLQMLMKISDHDSKQARKLYVNDQLTAIFSMLTKNATSTNTNTKIPSENKLCVHNLQSTLFLEQVQKIVEAPGCFLCCR